MKKIFTFLFVMMLTVASLFAQAPQKMSYQAVVRNSNNALVTEQTFPSVCPFCKAVPRVRRSIRRRTR